MRAPYYQIRPSLIIQQPNSILRAEELRMSQLLTELGNLKENNRLEVKRARGGVPQTLWQTYSSFANTMGGTIILGVDEDTEGNLHVVGVPDAQQYVKTIWNTLNNRQKVSRNILVDQNVRIE
jgi:ATP-dependent DNA helicase RecG